MLMLFSECFANIFAISINSVDKSRPIILINNTFISFYNISILNLALIFIL